MPAPRLVKALYPLSWDDVRYQFSERSVSAPRWVLAETLQVGCQASRLVDRALGWAIHRLTATRGERKSMAASAAAQAPPCVWCGERTQWPPIETGPVLVDVGLDQQWRAGIQVVNCPDHYEEVSAALIDHFGFVTGWKPDRAG